MKANIFRFLAVGLLLPLFSSCGGGDDAEDAVVDPPEPAKKAVYVDYNYSDPGDMLTVFDIDLEYTNEKGETVKEKLTASPWTKTLSKLTLPFKARLKVVLTPKDNIPEQERYKLGDAAWLQVYREGEDFVDYSSSASNTQNLSPEYLEAAIVRFGKTQEYVINIEWKGNTTVSTPDE